METAFYTQPLIPPSQEDATEDVSTFAKASEDVSSYTEAPGDVSA
jgi:hypothetical protein